MNGKYTAAGILAILSVLSTMGLARSPQRNESGNAITLVENGKTAYHIVLSQDPSAMEKRAAKELQATIREISGADLPIVAESPRPPARMILVGESELLRSLKPGIDLKSLGEEGFAIKTVGPHLVIVGERGPGRMRGVFEMQNGKRVYVYRPVAPGTLYGVYTFLEDTLGCRWYTSTARVFPKKSTIRIPRLDVRQKPDFDYRNVYYFDAFNPEFGDHLRRNEAPYDNRVHTFWELVPEEKYRKTHPEYFALIKGKRTNNINNGQICLTNPDVAKIATAKVLEWIEANPNARTFSVSQNDVDRGCECPRCKAMDTLEGSPAGALLRFVNAIADEVKTKHPEVWIDTLAYQYTEKPPRITKPHANVRIRLCPINNCEFHPYDHCDFPPTVAFMANFRGWQKLTRNLDLWHYSSTYHHLLAPLIDFDQLGASMRMYRAAGTSNVFIEGGGMPGAGGFMDELKTYLVAKLLWNTNTDVHAVVTDFLNGYYGRAGAPIGQWLDLIQGQMEKQKLHASCWPDQDFRISHPGFKGRRPFLYLPAMTPAVIAQSDLLFDAAEKSADNPDILRRVRHARMSLEYVKTVQQLDQARTGTPEQKLKARARWEAFAKACEADGILYLGESRTLESQTKKVNAFFKK